MCLVHASYKASVAQTRQEDIAVFPLKNKARLVYLEPLITFLHTREIIINSAPFIRVVV